MNKLIAFALALVLCGGAFAFTAQHESNQTSPALVNITSTTLYDSITLDAADETFSCENCSDISGTLSLDAGAYVLALEATLGNETTYENFTLSIYELAPPINETDVTNATVNTTTNVTTNTSINTTTNITTNITANVTANTTVNATTNVTTNATNSTVKPGKGAKNDTEGNGTSRFATGFNKLPQAVAAGEITDAELAAILRANQLNPGIINRLVKTGKLRNESLSAIIEGQKTPPGIFAKLGRAIGIDVKTAKDRIPDLYNLTEEQQAKLSNDPDVSKKTGKVLKEKVAEKQAAKAGKAAEKTAVKEQKQAEKAEKQDGKQAEPKNQTGKPEKSPKNDTGKPADKPKQK